MSLHWEQADNARLATAIQLLESVSRRCISFGYTLEEPARHCERSAAISLGYGARL